MLKKLCKLPLEYLYLNKFRKIQRHSSQLFYSALCANDDLCTKEDPRAISCQVIVQSTSLLTLFVGPISTNRISMRTHMWRQGSCGRQLKVIQRSYILERACFRYLSQLNSELFEIKLQNCHLGRFSPERKILRFRGYFSK